MFMPAYGDDFTTFCFKVKTEVLVKVIIGMVAQLGRCALMGMRMMTNGWWGLLSVHSVRLI